MQREDRMLTTGTTSNRLCNSQRKPSLDLSGPQSWVTAGKMKAEKRVPRLSPKARGPGLCGTEELSGLSGAVVRGQETKRSMEARLSLYSLAS